MSLSVPKCAGPGAAWSASQLHSDRDENIYDLRGVRSFPTLEDEGKCHLRTAVQHGTSGLGEEFNYSHCAERCESVPLWLCK